MRVGIELTPNCRYKWEVTNMWHIWVHTFNLCGICKSQVCIWLWVLQESRKPPGTVENSKDGSTDEQKLNITSLQSLKNWLAKLFDKEFVVQLQAAAGIVGRVLS